MGKDRTDIAEVAVVVRLEAEQATARRVADVLAESLDPEEAASAAVADPSGRWAVEITFRQPPNEAAVRSLVRLVAGADAADQLSFTPLAQRDWVAASLAGLAPVVAGRFVVHGAHSRSEVRSNQTGIEVEAALAFGTGHHGTTRGCLLALERIAKRDRRRTRRDAGPSRRYRVLDLGTGTGVLAIAAAKAFRIPVLASDLDRAAAMTARRNVQINRVGRLVQVLRAAGVSAWRFQEGGPYDLIFANILLRPLQQLAAPLARLGAPGGQVVLSGLLPEQASAALAAYRMQGLVLERRLIEDDWATLVLKRPRRRR